MENIEKYSKLLINHLPDHRNHSSTTEYMRDGMLNVKNSKYREHVITKFITDVDIDKLEISQKYKKEYDDICKSAEQLKRCMELIGNMEDNLPIKKIKQ